MYTASIVIPTYNSSGSIGPTLESVRPALGRVDVEVIFVDDCSKDNTLQILQSFTNEFENATVYSLAANSGSASAPRNFGLKSAKGTYVFFLDSDDPLNASGFSRNMDLAADTGADIVRAPIEVRRSGRSPEVVDQILAWDSFGSVEERIAAIVRHQSLTVSCLFKREMLLANEIDFDLDRRIGEDIVFTATALMVAEQIEYCDAPMRSYVRSAEGSVSVTQALSSRDFADFFRSWDDIERLLASRNVSFFELHGLSAINYCLRQFMWFGKEPIADHDLSRISSVLGAHWNAIVSLPFTPRYKSLLNTLRSNDVQSANEVLKIRLLVAGHDLKFVDTIVGNLSARYEVRFDRWDGHNQHNQLVSEQMLEWADVIWCEWLLGAAVWYSARKRADQELIVRCHRSELMVSYGERIKRSAVSKFVAISPHGLDDFSDRFAISRRKMELIPNAVDVESYRRRAKDREFSKRLLLVGAVPRLKGYHRAIELLANLCEVDERYTLTVAGRNPEELDWLWNNDDERRYFETCESRIDILGLREKVNFLGWRNLKQEYSEYDILLSLSDYEGCQVAPLEAMAAGVVPVIRPWRGAAECYPDGFVVNDEQFVSRILELEDPQEYQASVLKGFDFVGNQCSVDEVVRQVDGLMRSFKL